MSVTINKKSSSSLEDFYDLSDQIQTMWRKLDFSGVGVGRAISYLNGVKLPTKECRTPVDDELDCLINILKQRGRG